VIDLDSSVASAGVTNTTSFSDTAASSSSSSVQEGLARLKRNERGAWVLLTNHCFCEQADQPPLSPTTQVQPLVITTVADAIVLA
jgi:hypothetical protein